MDKAKNLGHLINTKSSKQRINDVFNKEELRKRIEELDSIEIEVGREPWESSSDELSLLRMLESTVEKRSRSDMAFLIANSYAHIKKGQEVPIEVIKFIFERLNAAAQSALDEDDPKKRRDKVAKELYLSGRKSVDMDHGWAVINVLTFEYILRHKPDSLNLALDYVLKNVPECVTNSKRVLRGWYNKHYKPCIFYLNINGIKNLYGIEEWALRKMNKSMQER